MRKDDSDALETLSFEEALERLEGIVEALEEGNLPLEEAISTFERGTALRKICERRIKEAERRIEILLREEDGLTAKPLEQEAEDEDSPS